VAIQKSSFNTTTNKKDSPPYMRKSRIILVFLNKNRNCVRELCKNVETGKLKLKKKHKFELFAFTSLLLSKHVPTCNFKL